MSGLLEDSNRAPQGSIRAPYGLREALHNVHASIAMGTPSNPTCRPRIGLEINRSHSKHGRVRPKLVEVPAILVKIARRWPKSQTRPGRGATLTDGRDSPKCGSRLKCRTLDEVSRRYPEEPSAYSGPRQILHSPAHKHSGRLEPSLNPSSEETQGKVLTNFILCKFGRTRHKFGQD